MSFKDLFMANQAKVEAKQKKLDAKQKAAEEKEQEKLKNPKYKAKIERKAKKALAKEEKRLLKIDKNLTEIFNRLNEDDSAILNAVEKNDGELTQNICGFNTFGQFCKRGGGLFVQTTGKITPDLVTKNKAFQQYKERMAKEGFNLDIISTSDGSSKFDMGVSKCITTPFLALGTAATIALPPLFPMAILGLGVTSINVFNTASFCIKITKKEAPESKQLIKDTSQCNEHSQQVIKEPEKVPTPQRNIIR